MGILTNKDEIIKHFEGVFDEIINTKDLKVSELTLSIRSMMLEIGAKVFESWFYENINTGYKGSKIFEKINGKTEMLKFHNNLPKTYISCLGEIKLKRAYYKNKHLKYFPIEEKYSWLKDNFLPDVKELSCFVSMSEPYEMASLMLKKVGEINISSSSLQKITKRIGEKIIKSEDEKISNPIDYHENKNEIDLLVVSCDGSCINTDSDWKEVKSGAIYQVKKDKNNELHAFNKSYISRIENSNDFGKRLYEESRRRGLRQAKQIVTIGDGAKWIWEQSKKHFPHSVEIVDWFHATEHLWKTIELMFGNKDIEEGRIFEKICEDLLYEGLVFLMENTILEKLKELGIKEKSHRFIGVEKELNYFKKNEKRMKYSYFKNHSYPIGSGVIEGACKHLVQIRMKRNGMKWSIEGAHDILQLRSFYLSNRWNEVQNVIDCMAA